MSYKQLCTLLSFMTFSVIVTNIVTAQTTKNISVSQTDSYTDHIALDNDSKDMDLMVKFVFDETKNTLTVSLISYRTLFVFWDNTRYGKAVKHRRIKPDNLPYVVSSHPGDRFRVARTFRKSISRPHRKHVLKKWIEVHGLQPVDKELMMVNDFIEQTFDIQGKLNTVTIRLRDVMLLDEVKKKSSSSHYDITFGKDLNITYKISIQRNPCFGLEDEIAASASLLEAVSKNYATLRKNADKVSEEASLNVFRGMKETLIEQFPKNNEESRCPEVQQARDKYNSLVDSIQAIKVDVNTAISESGAASPIVDGKSLNAAEILSNARILDQTVSKWLASNDPAERSDLIAQGRSIIKDVNLMIGGKQAQSAEESNAIKVFRKAEKYFYKVCK
jgi:hypothetical protein